MPTRKEQLFSATKESPGAKHIIPATVRFRHDKKAGTIGELGPEEKMVCALRKALSQMSDQNKGVQRFYITRNKIQLITRPTATAGKKGEPQTYFAVGRCRLGVAHAGDHITTKVIQFSITFRDTRDSRGLPDVEFIEPTSIDELPKDTPIDVAPLS